MTDDQIKHMAERFLCWRLPDDFNPDAGITYTPVSNPGTPHEFRHAPTGTNLLTFAQAKAMVKHMLEGLYSTDAIHPAPIEFTQRQLDDDPILRFFHYAHLPPALQPASRPLCELAHQLVTTLPRNAERSVALRKLLEAKDAAVRAALAK